MGFLRRSDPKPDPGIVVDEKSYKAWKEDPGSNGQGWIATLTNELASSKPGYTSQVPTAREVEVGSRRGSQYVFEEATGLESSRPKGRMDRRSVSPDSPPVVDRRTGRNVYQPVRLFSLGGIFGARQPDMSGGVPFQRWPSETQPRGGCSIPGCTCGR